MYNIGTVADFLLTSLRAIQRVWRVCCRWSSATPPSVTRTGRARRRAAAWATGSGAVGHRTRWPPGCWPTGRCSSGTCTQTVRSASPDTRKLVRWLQWPRTPSPETSSLTGQPATVSARNWSLAGWAGRPCRPSRRSPPASPAWPCASASPFGCTRPSPPSPPL